MNEADQMTTTGAAARLPVPPQHPDANLIAACEEYIAADLAGRADCFGDGSPASTRYIAAFDAVAASGTPSTLEGVLALARAATTMARCPDGSLAFDAAAGLWAGDALVGLLRLHGENV